MKVDADNSFRFSNFSRRPIASVVAIVWTIVCNGAVTAEEARTKGIKPDRATTWLTEPLRDDGTIDYLAAANNGLSSDIEPQDNCAINLISMSDDGELRGGLRERLLPGLKIDDYPDEPKIIGLGKFLDDAGIRGNKNRQEIVYSLDKAIRHKITEDESPNLTAWVRANQRAIVRLREVVEKPAFFCPLVDDEEPQLLVASRVPMVSVCRACARLLAADAMVCLRKGDYEAFRHDLVAIRAISRHLADNQTLVELFKDGYTLRSIGPNELLQDDIEDGDDLVVQMPARR